MVGSDELVFEGNPNSPPRPFAVAAWLGMSPDAIRAGLADGSIAPPPGAMPDWEPPRTIPLFGYAASDPARAGNESGGAGNEFSVDDVGAAVGRSQVSDWFRALDPVLTDAAFDAIWHRAGDGDAARAANLTAYLSRTLLEPSSALASPSSELTAFAADPSHRVRVIDLAGMDGATLASLSRTDVGYRYAMSQMDSIALTGNRALFSGANANNALDRFDPDTGEVLLSDAWLSDRGKFLAWKMAGATGQSLDIDGAQSWTFIDRSKLGDDAQPMTMRLTASSGGADENHVTFGAESAESIKGGTATDRIYGGGGDDVLHGAAGADRLEGGKGDDLLFGGSGNDEIAGNQGDDDLEGGRGADTLDGGSGDDIISGGRGDDVMAGGVGADVYVIDAGDGDDTIADTDGAGSISLDDETLTGATLNQDGTWISVDGRLDYSFVDDLEGEGTLTIRAFGAGADHSGMPDSVIHVNNWHDGDLGITLGHIESTIPVSEPDTGPQIIEDNIPIDSIDLPPPPDSGSQIMADGVPLDDIDLPTPVPVIGPVALGADTGLSGIGASVGNEAGGTIVSAPTVIAPIVDDAATAIRPEIDDAISQLLTPPDNYLAALDAALVQNAVAAFSGVLTPPDVPSLGGFGSDHGGNAVSIADIASALADAAGGHDASEAGSALVPMTPDWHRVHIEPTASFAGARPQGHGSAIRQN